MNEAVIKSTGVRKQHKSDAYYCEHCGAFREQVERGGQPWFACPDGCENEAIDKRIADLRAIGAI